VNPEEWERLLLDATDRVRKRISGIERRRDRGRALGIGASGDKTIYADKQAEDELLKILKKVEGVRVLSEEIGFAGDARARTLTVVDPLDGSSNFERGIPYYCTSVAVVEGDSIEDITVGVVRDLRSGDVYAATRGGGARKNGKPIRTSRTSDLSAAVVGVDLSRSTASQVLRLAPLIGGAMRQVHLGANALELCHVAEGRIDAFVDIRGKIRVTDFAAAYLVACEAGAKITGDDGRKLETRFDLVHRLSFVASANSHLHKEILRLCNTSASWKG
jgi:myo-inositol-1(or 4)-monophosphatase